MKIKYYLRGFGLGIVVTAIIFAIANVFTGAGNTSTIGQNAEQTTSSVLAYTKETQTTTAAEQSQAATDSAQTTDSEQATKQADQAGETITVATVNQKETAANIAGNDNNTGTTSAANMDGAATASAETLKAGQKVSVDIVNIKYMYEVGDILYTKGIIADVKEFNNYMIANGYDVKLREGTYELTAGDTYQNIAKIITRS